MIYAHVHTYSQIRNLILTLVAGEIKGTVPSTIVKFVSSAFNLSNKSSTTDKRS